MSRISRASFRPATFILAGALCLGSISLPGSALASEAPSSSLTATTQQRTLSPQERAIEGGVAANDPLVQPAFICWIAPTFPWLCKQPHR